MKSRAARLSLSALAWIALGAAAYFTFDLQRQIDARQSALRSFESSARDAADALDDLQVAQQAYVAHGQDAREWIPKVTTFLQTATASIDSLRSTANSAAAGPALLDAGTAITQVGNIDKHVREQLTAGENQTAADIIFGEAADAVSSAVSNVDTAVGAEQQTTDGFVAELRRLQLYALAGAAGFAAIALAVLGVASPRARTVHKALESVDALPTAKDLADSSAPVVQQAIPVRPPVAPPAPEPPPTPASEVALRSMALLCTDFGRVREASDVNTLLQRSAEVLNARGIIVWLGDAAGADLRPVFAHGYTDSTLARIPTVARTGDNAAAAAYRSGEVQIVKSRPNASQGAIVAPLMAADGCIGALTAEIRDRGEESETTRAVALILAAQLAGVLATATTEAAPAAEAKTAAG